MKVKDPSFIPYRLAGAYLTKELQKAGMESPSVGIICGSGLSGLSNCLQEPTLTISYGSIPGFPSHCTVPGHHGEVVFGMLSDVPTICFRGRFHSYEGHDMKVTALPVYVMRCLNVRVCIVTNAAGGLNPHYQVGDVITVSDHLAIPQLAGKNPLVGPNDDELGPRFPATSNAYPDDLRLCAKQAADRLGFDFVRTQGVYCFVSGPMYESKAECRFLRSLGGDCVGMSTIPEVIVSHHCNMKTLCLSLITNLVIMSPCTAATSTDTDGDGGTPTVNNVATHEEVLEAVQQRSEQMQTLVQEIVSLLRESILPKLPLLRSVTMDLEGGTKKSDLYRHASSISTNWMEGWDEENEENSKGGSNGMSIDPMKWGRWSQIGLGIMLFALGIAVGTTSPFHRKIDGK